MAFQKEYDYYKKKLNELKVKKENLKGELKLAYDYQEDVIGKIKFAKDRITKKQKEYQALLIKMQQCKNDVKKSFDEEMENEIINE